MAPWGPPRWGWAPPPRHAQAGTSSLGRRPDPAAGHSGKPGHARRRGRWEAVQAAALEVGVWWGVSLLTRSGLRAGRCRSRPVFTFSYLIVAAVDLTPCPASVFSLLILTASL